MHKKSENISVEKVLILTADFSPKCWVRMSDRTGQNSLKLVDSFLKSGHDRKKIRSEIMQWIRTIFVFEIVNCFLDVFFKSRKLMSILHIPQTIPLFRSNYILSSMDFFYVPAVGQYTREEGGGGKEENPSKGKNGETKNIKVQKMHKKSEIISVKKVLMLTADFSPKCWVRTSDRTGQNSLKLVHSLLKSCHDRKKIRSEIMQCIRTIFELEIVNCFLDVFFKSRKLMSILHIPQTIPLFRSNYILSSMDFFYVPAVAQYTREEGGGVKEENSS